MSETIALQSVLPTLSAEKITTANIKKYGELLRTDKSLFPALKNVPVDRMRQRKESVYIPDTGNRDPDGRVLFELGDYIVFSSNGTRHFAKSDTINHGAVIDLPSEMFLPVGAKVLFEIDPFPTDRR